LVFIPREIAAIIDRGATVLAYPDLPFLPSERNPLRSASRCCLLSIYLENLNPRKEKLKPAVRAETVRRCHEIHSEIPMNESTGRWLDLIQSENAKFRDRIETGKLPVQRMPGQIAVITCMDPRVNLEAMGIPSFTQQGENASSIRIMRSIGAMAEPRSLAIAMHLAGIREFAVLMHTDCGCCLAHSRIDAIIRNMEQDLSTVQLHQFKRGIGEPFRDNLIDWLKAFDDPREAVKKEVASIRALSFVPDGVVLHGLLYDLASGGIEIIVNGYEP
jgi:carbonic anhydrase